MLALVIFLFIAAVGYSFLLWLPVRLTRGEIVASSIILGTVIAGWLFFLSGWLVGYRLGLPLVFAAIAIFLAVSVWQHKRGLLEWSDDLWHGKGVWRSVQYVVLVVVTFYAALIALTHSLEIVDGAWYGRGYTWSDLPLHMALMSNVAYQDHFTFTMPVYYVEKLSYPFLFDMFSGILLRIGGSWQWTLGLSTLAIFLSMGQLFIGLSYRLVRSMRATWIHVMLFFVSGSVWGLALFMRDFSTEGFTALTRDYANIQDGELLFFANSITSHFMPQRGFLLGFGVALLMMILLTQVQKRRLQIFEGVLLGLLPFVHVHTFFVLVGLLLVLTLQEFILQPERKQHWWLPALLGVVIALPQLLWQFVTTYHSSFGYWHIGWAFDGDGYLISFLVRNFGVTLLFVVGAIFIAKRYLAEAVLIRGITLLSVLLFVAVHVRIFQPNIFDNMKFLLYGYWGVTLLMAYVLSRWSRVWYGAVASGLIVILTCGSGVLALAREQSAAWPEFSATEVQFAADMRDVLPLDAKILTSERHNHPIPTLTGRKILMGYTGWLWSYGFNVRPLQSDIYRIWSGAPNADELLKKYEVHYVIFSDQEAFSLQIDEMFFRENYELIYNQYGWNVFRVN